MKLSGSAVRFVFVSATVPNIQDIASWIGREGPNGSAEVFEVRLYHNNDVVTAETNYTVRRGI